MVNSNIDLITDYLHFVDRLCHFNYEAGREAARVHLPKDYILQTALSKGTIEPQPILAWEAGYDDQIKEWCDAQAS